MKFEQSMAKKIIETEHDASANLLCNLELRKISQNNGNPNHGTIIFFYTNRWPVMNNEIIIPLYQASPTTKNTKYIFSGITRG